MRFYLLNSALILGLLCSSSAIAQHSDIEFGYNDLTNPTGFEIEAGGEIAVDGTLIFEADMEDPGGTGDFSSEDPGFAQNPAEGLLLQAGDRIYVEIMNPNSVYGFANLGPVTYFNPGSNPALGFLEADANRRLNISEAPYSRNINGLGFEGAGENFFLLDVADTGGEIHDHFVVDLLDDATAPFGAYGVMFRLHSDRFSNGYLSTPVLNSMDVSSDPFWIVWNHGMSVADFENFAIPAFSAVPEPGSMLFLGMVSLGLLTQRRRMIQA